MSKYSNHEEKRKKVKGNQTIFVTGVVVLEYKLGSSTLNRFK